ncbi:hypothetical protein K466DRAFT_606455 [Polyporus arcularius HHB13444]|uniref:Uncharacterized protein n=1 Tax=Polyporus arcularius HHB13444 TaxID=1314778 RepID=A0A5C3NNE4_9APHY|nr:hypothetical protein K466DRAFT_606455 [Polyporus arcularius HHB13444]
MPPARADVAITPQNTLLALPLPTLLERLARLLRGERQANHLYIGNIVLQECLATPGLSDLSMPVLASLVTAILDCASEFPSRAHTSVHSAPAERTMARGARARHGSLGALESDGWTSSVGQTFHVSAITYPDGHRYMIPRPRSVAPLPRVEVLVLDDVGNNGINVDNEEFDDDTPPPLVDL